MFNRLISDQCQHQNSFFLCPDPNPPPSLVEINIYRQNATKNLYSILLCLCCVLTSRSDGPGDRVNTDGYGEMVRIWVNNIDIIKVYRPIFTSPLVKNWWIWGMVNRDSIASLLLYMLLTSTWLRFWIFFWIFCTFLWICGQMVKSVHVHGLYWHI